MLFHTIANIPEPIRPFLIKRVYEKGEYILTAGGDNLHLYLVESGSCVATMEGYSGAVAFIDSYHSGDMFGELEIFCEDLKTAEVVAVEKSTIYMVHKTYVLEWMKLDFDFTLSLIEHLVKKLRYHSRRAVLLQLCSVEERVACAILGHDDAGALEFLTKQNLSVLAQTPIRSVNRALETLIQRGCIRVSEKRIQITDRPLLEQISNYQAISQL